MKITPKHRPPSSIRMELKHACCTDWQVFLKGLQVCANSDLSFKGYDITSPKFYSYIRVSVFPSLSHKGKGRFPPSAVEMLQAWQKELMSVVHGRFSGPLIIKDRQGLGKPWAPSPHPFYHLFLCNR